MYGTSLDGMFVALFIFFALVGAAIAALLFWFVPWLWDLVQPWLHAVTAPGA